MLKKYITTVKGKDRKMLIFSIQGLGKDCVIWDETCLRSRVFGEVIIPELVKSFDRVIVFAGDASAKRLSSMPTPDGWQKIEKIPWTEVNAVIHMADPHWHLNQAAIEEMAVKLGIPVFRLEDMPGAVLRRDMNTKKTLPVLDNVHCLVINEVSKTIAREGGVVGNRIKIVGLPDFHIPNHGDVEKWQGFISLWKRKMGLGEQRLWVYSCTGTGIDVDAENLEILIKLANQHQAVLIACTHPKLYLSAAPDVQGRAAEFDSFFIRHGFRELNGGGWDALNRLFYWKHGVRKLVTAVEGCLAGVPADLLPADLCWFSNRSGAVINALWGTPALNLLLPKAQSDLSARHGLSPRMASDAEPLPLLRSEEEIVSALDNILDGGPSFDPDRILETLPYTGSASVSRIVAVVKSKI